MLGELDGHHSVAELVASEPSLDVLSILAALVRGQVVFDGREFWRAQALTAANPPLFSSPLTVDAAYAKAAYEPPQGEEPAPRAPRATTPFWEVAAARRSAMLDVGGPWSPDQALACAYDAALAATALSPTGQRAVSSAGGLRPLQLAVLVRAGTGWEVRLVDHLSRTFGLPRAADDARVRLALLNDEEWALGAVRRGAALLVIAADPSRTCGKYGNRGWQYLHAEAGAVAHHVGLVVTAHGGSSRQLGGFADAPARELLGTADLSPLLCMIIVPPAENAA